MSDTIKQAIDAISAMLTHMGMDEDEWNKPTFDQARAALAALRARPERKRSVIWGKSPVLINGLKFDLLGDRWFLCPEDGIEYEISTAQPDHSKLVKRLRGITSESWGQIMVIADKAADALEGK